ncbi:hypothetical protein QQZ08_004035 [Neonectria magnoliae]|uniref:Uncharacterized protein n=1 Tax=Neonectria magnoliae TaxID=2732573 RepID=A0ABR1I767_9HYPO
MAPYTMKIFVANNTQFSVFPIGSSTLNGLDGHTEVGTLTVSPNSTGGVEIAKSGGVDGLFAAHWDVKNQFSVYTYMPAGWGEDARVIIDDVDGMSWDQFKSSGPRGPANGYHYSLRCDTYNYPDTFDHGNVRIQLERVTLDFPTSECRITVSE